MRSLWLVRRRTLPARWSGTSVVVALAGAVALVPSYAAGPAAAAGGDCPYGVESPCVIVTVQDGSRSLEPVVIGRADVVAPADGPRGTDDYVLQNTKGDRVPASTCVGDRTTRLQTLLRQAVGQTSASGDQVSFAEVLDGGARHVVSRDDLGRDDVPAIVCDFNGDKLLYLRSARDDDDLNGAPGVDDGQFFSADRGPLYVTAHVSGDLLTPAIEATPDDGNRASFAFSADGVPAGATYHWEFGDGDESGLASPTHVYDEPDGYAVTLEVSLADGSFGNDDIVVTAGTLPSGSPSPGGPTTPAVTGSPTPPVATETGTPSATSSGPVSSPATTATTTGPPQTGSGTGTGTADPTATGPSTDPGTGGATGGGSATGDPTGVSTQPGGAEPSDLVTPSGFLPPPVLVSPGGVSGVLLQALGRAPGSSAAGGPADQVLADTVGSDDESTRIDPRLWSALVILALLAAGAASESRGVHAWLRRRRPWFRMTS